MFRSLFTRSSTTGSGQPGRRQLHRAAWFGGGLVLLWVLLQFAPGSPPDTASLYSDESGTVAMDRPARSGRGGFSFGYVVVLVLLAGGGYVAFRLKKGRPEGPHPSSPLETLGQVPISLGQHLRLVACGDEVLVLGVTSSQITLLKSYPREALTAQAPAQADMPAAASAGFADLLRQYAGSPRTAQTADAPC